jgi:2-phosphosulfolactate phosphatase
MTQQEVPMPKIDVCFSPHLLDLYDLNGKTAVIVDVLRATSCIVAGLGSGVTSILPVATLEECKVLEINGYTCAGERNGHRVEGFALGNSPFEYMTEAVKGKKIAMTTTNGTQALVMSKAASQILIGSFLNLSALATYLDKQANDILVVCAGWKGKFCIEDTLFAGALAEALPYFVRDDDSTLAAFTLYKSAKSNLYKYLLESAHYKRLSHLEGGKDVEFCIKIDEFEIVPILVDGEVIRAT